MSLQNQIASLRTTLGRLLRGSLAMLGKAFSGLAQGAIRHPTVPADDVVPILALAGGTNSAPAEAPASHLEAVALVQSPTAEPPAPPADETKVLAVEANALATSAKSEPIDLPELTTSTAPSPMTSEPNVPPRAPRARAKPKKRRDHPTLVVDPELSRLQTRVEAMETRVLDLETRKIEMEQLIDEYAFCQYQAVGDLLGEQLRLQHEALRLRAERSSTETDLAAADAAAEEYENFQRARTAPAAPPPAQADSEREELTALYRATVMRCHPDRVDEAEKDRAHEFFLRTQDAYRRRDLDALRLIGKQIATSKLPAASHDRSTPRERLEALLEALESKGVEVLLAMESLQAQAQYRRARRRDLWDDYFSAARDRLDDECAALRRQIARG